MFKNIFFKVVLAILFVFATVPAEAAEDGGLLLRLIPKGGSFSVIIGNRESTSYQVTLRLSPGVMLVGLCDGNRECIHTLGTLCDACYAGVHPIRVPGFTGMVTATASFEGARSSVTLTETFVLESKVAILDADENIIVLSSDEDIMLAANGGEQQLFVEGGLFKILNANCFMYLYPAGCIRLTSLTAPEGVVIESNSPRWEVSSKTASRRNVIYLPLIVRP